MALMGAAALAMWWEVDASLRQDFEHWHTHEHFAERLAIPGFRRASRWRSEDGGEGFFVMYELASHDVVSSQPYLERLNAPSPWSTKMMPHHRHMVRSQCRVLESAGASITRHALTVRLSPENGQQERLRQHLKTLAFSLVSQPGCVGGHLLRHETPAIAQTTEQKIRGGDRLADWVFIASGYDAQALQSLMQDALAPAALKEHGAAAGAELGLYTLSHSAATTDLG